MSQTLPRNARTNNSSSIRNEFASTTLTRAGTLSRGESLVETNGGEGEKQRMLQELKKENFDLKLRLYMTQKNSESAEGKVGEYEQQLAALLNSLEEQQRLSEQQSRELDEARHRERKLVHDHKKLESQCKEQDETINNLSLNLSKVSKSMHDISLTTTGSTNGQYSSTPVRNARSEYFPSNADDGANGSGAEDEGNVRPFSTTTNISHVPPMRRGDPSTHDTSNLLDNDQASHHSFNNDTTPNRYNTTNYHYHNNASDDRTVNLPEGPPDIVGVVRPNNTRTVVDVEIPPEPIQEKPVPKKKKKGIMKVFKLCTGKSGQAMEQSKDDMYVKQEPARVTMTTYTNESVN